MQVGDGHAEKIALPLLVDQTVRKPLELVTSSAVQVRPPDFWLRGNLLFCVAKLSIKLDRYLATFSMYQQTAAKISSTASG